MNAPCSLLWTTDAQNETRKARQVILCGKDDNTATPRITNLMRIYVRTLTGYAISIDVEPNDPVREVKRLVYEKQGFPIEQQRLIYAGKLIEDHRSLAYYKINAEVKLHLILSKNDNQHKKWNIYFDSIPIRTEMLPSPIVLQYSTIHPHKTKIESRTTSPSKCTSYQELYLKLWFEYNQMYPASGVKTSEARCSKYQKIFHGYKLYGIISGEPHKGWKSQARKALPEVLAKCGYNKADIEFLKDTKLFDIVDAFKYIARRRLELIIPSSELTPFFFNHKDVVIGVLMPHLSLCDRMHFSVTCKEFNSIARQPIVWRHLCLLHDRARVRDHHFINILNQYGSFIHALSIQKCIGLTDISLKMIGDKCPNLRILNAADNPFFDIDEQNAVFSKAIKLQYVNISLTPDHIAKIKLEPIGSIDALKELKELIIAGRRPKDTTIAHETLKVLDVRDSMSIKPLNVNCPQLEVLIIDRPHVHPKRTTKRTSKIYVCRGASDPQSFEGIESNTSESDEYHVLNSY